MVRAFPLFAWVLLSLHLKGISGKKGFKDFIPQTIQACCSDRLPSDSCPKFVGAANGRGTTFYAFHELLYTEISSVRPNGYPEITSPPKAIDAGWPKLTSKTTPIQGAFKYKGEIFVTSSVGYNVYDDNRKHVRSVSFSCPEVDFFCPKAGAKGRLFAAMVTPRGPNNKEPLTWAWYRNENVDDVDVRVFEGMDTKQKVYEKKDEKEFLTQAAVVFREDQKHSVSYGFDFIADRRVLPFDLPFGNFNLRKFENLMKHPGHGMQVFLGCPPPFCYNADMDDARLVTDNPKTTLILYRGQYYWKLEVGKTFPVKMPTAGDAILIESDLLPEHPSHIDAAVSVDDARGKLVILSKDANLWVYNNNALVTKSTIKSFFGLPASTPIDHLDTIWYNKVDNKMYLFKGAYYWVSIYKGDKWVVETPTPGSLRDFKGIVSGLDAAFSIKEFGYIFKGNWYYKIPEKSWRNPAVPYGAALSLGSSAASLGFFATKEGCKFSDKEFNALRKLMNSKYRPQDELIPGETRPPPFFTRGPDWVTRSKNPGGGRGVGEKDDSKMGLYLLLVGAIVVTVIVIVVLFLVLSKKKKKSEPKADKALVAQNVST